MNLLAFTPLYDPLTALYPGMSQYWMWLVVPLVLVISIVYKCTRIEKLSEWPRTSVVMATETIIMMVIAAMLLAATYWLYVRIPWNH